MRPALPSIRPWLIVGGVVAGALIGLQTSNCDDCMVPNFAAALVGGAVGGVFVRLAVRR